MTVWLAVAWLAGGYVGVMTERFAGWPFDMWLITIPIGRLALTGADQLVSRMPRVPVWAVLALALAPAIVPMVPRVLGPAAASEFAAPSHALPAATPVGKVYVFGDPRVLLDSGRPMATSVHGWAWEVQPPQMWPRLAAELQAAPPVAIFMDLEHQELIAKQSPELSRWIDRHYGPTGPRDVAFWRLRQL